ncbi:MAG: GntR family transcriptional regulator [Halomonas sp.]|uniref:GntR family transcriptional regulator n=1 Tax=Halomonas sp. AOP42-C1-46 TaxID=3457671 RepID=UPI003FB8B48E
MTEGIQNGSIPKSVFDDVSALLRKRMKGITEPVRIREGELASQLGVSRTPVREALIRLESTGMVSLQPGKGALLCPVTDKDYVEWLQLREQLEGFATREAALNASQRDVERLRAIFEPFMTEGGAEAEQDAYGKANVSFHKEIIKLANNRLLNRVWDAFGHTQTTYRRQTIKRLHRSSNSLREHLAIIDAIEQRDAGLAETLAKEHVRALYKAVMQSLSEAGRLA